MLQLSFLNKFNLFCEHISKSVGYNRIERNCKDVISIPPNLSLYKKTNKTLNIQQMIIYRSEKQYMVRYSSMRSFFWSLVCVCLSGCLTKLGPTLSILFYLPHSSFSILVVLLKNYSLMFFLPLLSSSIITHQALSFPSFLLPFSTYCTSHLFPLSLPPSYTPYHIILLYILSSSFFM